MLVPNRASLQQFENLLFDCNTCHLSFQSLRNCFIICQRSSGWLFTSQSSSCLLFCRNTFFLGSRRQNQKKTSNSSHCKSDVFLLRKKMFGARWTGRRSGKAHFRVTPLSCFSFLLFPSFPFLFFLEMCFLLSLFLYFFHQTLTVDSSVVGAPWRCGVLTT